MTCSGACSAPWATRPRPPPTGRGGGAYRRGIESGHPFDAVILDLTVPGGVGGAKALELLRALDPAVKAIVSSGYSNDPVMGRYREHGFCGVLAKPFQVAGLGAVLSEVLG